MRIPTAINSILSDMVEDPACALRAYRYQTAAMANVEMDRSTTPCANFYCLSDWRVDISGGIVNEVAKVGIMFVVTQRDIDFMGEDNETLITAARDVSLDFIARLSASSDVEITTDSVEMRSVYDEYDANTTGVWCTVEVRERHGQCLDNYASN